MFHAFAITDKINGYYSESKNRLIMYFITGERKEESRPHRRNGGHIVGRIIYYPRKNKMHLTKTFIALLKKNDIFLKELTNFENADDYLFWLVPNEKLQTKERDKVVRLFFKELRKDKTLIPYLIASKL
jgi:hypothetical protein